MPAIFLASEQIPENTGILFPQHLTANISLFAWLKYKVAGTVAVLDKLGINRIAREGRTDMQTTFSRNWLKLLFV